MERPASFPCLALKSFVYAPYLSLGGPPDCGRASLPLPHPLLIKIDPQPIGDITIVGIRDNM